MDPQFQVFDDDTIDDEKTRRERIGSLSRTVEFTDITAAGKDKTFLNGVDNLAYNGPERRNITHL